MLVVQRICLILVLVIVALDIIIWLMPTIRDAGVEYSETQKLKKAEKFEQEFRKKNSKNYVDNIGTTAEDYNEKQSRRNK